MKTLPGKPYMPKPVGFGAGDTGKKVNSSGRQPMSLSPSIQEDVRTRPSRVQSKAHAVSLGEILQGMRGCERSPESGLWARGHCL